MQNQFKFKFKNFQYDLNDIITPIDISLSLDKFYNDELKYLDYNDKFCVLFKIKTSDGDWRNISSLQTLDKNGLNDLKEIFNLFWTYKSDVYKGLIIEKIVYRFRRLENDISPKENIFKYPTDLDKKGNELLPQGYTNLPNNRLFETWGDEVIINGDNTYVVNKDNHSFIITTFENENENHVWVNIKGKDILYFEDKYDENDKNTDTFMRTIGSSTIYYYKGKCNLLLQTLSSNYIKKLKPDISVKENIITLDLETRTIDRIMHVIAASIYDGYTVKSFYLTDFENSDELLKELITYLFQRKYNGYKIYIHNLKFDMAFMLRIISKMNNCEIKQFLKKDSKIISITVNYNLNGKRKYNIHFRDSLLILPDKLKNLGANFSVDVKKSIYPYRFVNNINISLKYKGEVPNIKFFDNISNEEYEIYSKKFINSKWSLRNETIKYCENDVISLYLIIKEFQKRIFRLFDADINKYPTLSSLAFAIYRMKYLKEYKIPIITGELYRNLKKSYTGGSVDVYKPVGKNINRYDVNSLYPAVMSDFPSPVGKIAKFKGDIFKYKKDPFGFFYVNIKTPDNLHIPILQTRIKTGNHGVRTISPLGEWSGWYFSEEILNAKKYGYEIEIIWGYIFEKEYIFKDYVKDLYVMKKNSSKSSPDYTISKLLLNSLYGRFGMNPEKEKHEIVKGSHNIARYIKLHNEGKICINDFLVLDSSDDIEIISYNKKREDEEDSMYDNINVAISSSITAYARIKMSEIKTKYSNNVYYSDTDSIDLDIELSNNYISNNLGDYKLEHVFEKVIYIAPKVYAAITKNEDYIKKNKSNEYIIIKGYKDDKARFDEIYKMINKNEIMELNHEKWYQDLSLGRIVIKEDKYTLMATESKRKLIYENNKLVKTIPYKLLNDKLL